MSVHGITDGWLTHFLIDWSIVGVRWRWKRRSWASSFFVWADLAAGGAPSRNWLAEVRCHGFQLDGSELVLEAETAVATARDAPSTAAPSPAVSTSRRFFIESLRLDHGHDPVDP